MLSASIRTWVLASLLAFLGGCSQVMVSEDIEHAVKGDTFDRSGDYKIGPADTLVIKVFGEESLSGTYLVAPSGMIQFPLVGFVTAQGMTQVQLAQRLETSLKPYVRDSRVAVSIGEAQSYQVYFSGEVATRGSKELKAKTSILQGIILAGGLTDYATGRIYIIRRVGPNEIKRYSTTFKELLRGRKILDFLYLERGDVIHAE